jgi:hypothetical protein
MVRPGRPLSAAEWAEVADVLGPALVGLFGELDVKDQRHSLEVLRSLDRGVPGASSEIRQAALLHDIGKANLRIGLVGRVFLSVVGGTPLTRLLGSSEDGAAPDRSAAVPPTAATAGRARVPLRTRMARYCRYEQLGSARLADLEPSPHPVVVAWAREHHLPEDEWSIPIEWGWVLQAADNGVLR